MVYAVIRINKIKDSESFGKRLDHNNRTFPEDRYRYKNNISQDRLDLNTSDVALSHRSMDKYLDEKRADLNEFKETQTNEEKKKAGTRRLHFRKNSAFAFEAMIQIGRDGDEMPDEHKKEFLKYAQKKVSEKFDGLELLDSKIHMDELTPHAHMIFGLYDKKENRWSNKRFFGEPESYNKLQNWITDIAGDWNKENHKSLFNKGYEIERGDPKKFEVDENGKKIPTFPDRNPILTKGQLDKEKQKAKDDFAKEVRLDSRISKALYDEIKTDMKKDPEVVNKIECELVDEFAPRIKKELRRDPDIQKEVSDRLYEHNLNNPETQRQINTLIFSDNEEIKALQKKKQEKQKEYNIIVEKVKKGNAVLQYLGEKLEKGKSALSKEVTAIWSQYKDHYLDMLERNGRSHAAEKMKKDISDDFFGR